MAHSRTWDGGYEADPADTDLAKLYAQHMRYLKEDIHERLVYEHSWAGNDNDGRHLENSARCEVVAIASRTVQSTAFGDGRLHYDSATGLFSICYEGAGDDWDAVNFVVGSATPHGAVTVGFPGQRFWDDTNYGWWTGKTAATTNWIADIQPDTVRMFRGTTIPDGWELCDGAGNTPNLRGRFIVGYHAGGDADYDAIDDTGDGSDKGEKAHTLLTAELAAHAHQERMFTATVEASSNPDLGQDAGGGYSTVPKKTNFAGKTVLPTTEDAGSDTAHENRPPFWTLAYIIKQPVS